MQLSEFEKYEREVDEAHQMKSLGSKFLDKFFREKELQLFEAFKECSIGDSAGLEKIHMAFKSMNSLQVEIQTVLNTGKLAKKSLEDADI